MKKTLCLILTVLLLTALLTGCGGGTDAGNDTVEGTLEELLEKVSKNASDPEVVLVNAEVNADSFSWYFFIDPIDGAEGLVAEPMIGSIPHCIGLLRLPASSDPEEVCKEIEANINPAKWLCVEAEKTAVTHRGDLVLLVMSTKEYVDQAVQNFEAL